MYLKLLETIEKYDSIVIFKHQRCDGDAMFSSLGFKRYLELNYPSKTAMIAGNDEYDRYPYHEEVSDEFISNSLAIILDTANLERCDDERYALAKEIVKIDHHPNREPYGALQIVKSESAATCELLGEIFFSEAFSNNKLNKDVCECLYCGILTDSLNFRTTSTTANTLLVASKLVAAGDLKPSGLSERMFDVSLDSYERITGLRNYLKTNGTLGYLILHQADLNQLKMSASDAKNQVHEFGGISDLNIWCIFVENENGSFDGSLRSKRGYIVNSIANCFGGGGHECAAGVKKLSQDDVDSIISMLITESQKSL